ncbi:kynureninase [Marinibacterium sp. SX1]|uniref:kynureninase n=1 Tax=Marinibacterium sp. SX1 TaxID=3388424 RepID=UPI003D16DDBC
MTDFAATKALFSLPEGMIYLDGNSLGPLPRAAGARVAQCMQDEWGEMLITAWNRAGWMDQPARLGDRIGRLIGAGPGQVVLGDTLSIKVYQALAAALDLRPDRKVVLSDTGNFPSDLYMAQGLLGSLDRGHSLRCVPPEEIEAALTEEVAVLMLTQVDYRTGRMHDMDVLTEKAHSVGALVIWDLAHSAGALPIDLGGAGADFAVGCTYKFLNSGPGGPAFIYVAPALADAARPALSGWLGHAEPFAFDPDYRPAPAIARMRVGTPPILQMAALDASLDIWDQVDMQALRARSIALSEAFIAGVEARCPQLQLASPRDPHRRGAQVSFRFDEGYAAMQALIAAGVVGDFRAPDIMRFGITPLYTDMDDIEQAVERLADVMDKRLWDNPKFRTRAGVT